MGGRNGGTQMYCPECGKITVCSSIPISQVLNSKTGNQQRLFMDDKSGDKVSFFRRGRQCHTCWNEFLTAEVDEGHLDELIELRDLLSEIKAHANKFGLEVEIASKTLDNLRGSLNLLRALK